MKKEKTIHISAKNIRYLVFAVILVAVLIIGFTIINSRDKVDATENPTGETTPENEGTVAEAETIQRATNVEILSSLLEVDKANDKIKTISGRVQNTGTVKASSVIIYASLYDTNNTLVKIEETRPIFNDLTPGQISQYILTTTETFSTFSLRVDWSEYN